jgi:hypothetical protein
MARAITTHHPGGADPAPVTLDAVEDAAGEPYVYVLGLSGEDGVTVDSTHLQFQRGPIRDGVNGITEEALLAIVVDRLEYDHRGITREDEDWALTYARATLGHLKKRTKRRMREDAKAALERDQAGTGRT